MLTELSLNDWLSVTKELQQNLTDEKIEEAFKLLPSNIYDISAKEIVAKLKRRRNDLEQYARDYYYFLSKEVNVAGTLQKEFFKVTRVNSDSTKVVVYKIDKDEQPSQVIYQRVFLQSETKEIRLYGFGGNDKFNITGKTEKSILIRVIGGQGRDILIGGAGQATLQAGAGGDILIGGTTDYDNNAAALAAVLAEWSSSDTYDNRRAHLTSGGGLNGSYQLNTGTVHDNGLADKLYGGAGMDWFFAGMADVIVNKTNGEAVTMI